MLILSITKTLFFFCKFIFKQNWGYDKWFSGTVFVNKIFSTIQTNLNWVSQNITIFLSYSRTCLLLLIHFICLNLFKDPLQYLHKIQDQLTRRILTNQEQNKFVYEQLLLSFGVKKWTKQFRISGFWITTGFTSTVKLVYKTEPWINQNPVWTEPWINQNPVWTEPWINQNPV